jgi:MOSC domain-containing protein
MEIRVSALSVTAIKATRLRSVESLALGPAGARGDRRFFIVDARGRMVNGKVFGQLQSVVADWDEEGRALTLAFPGGETVAGTVGEDGEPLITSFFSRPAEARLARGPWSRALSEFLGQAVRLVEIVPGDGRGSAVDRADGGAVSLISRASLAALAAAGRLEQVDARRFRMLIEVDGVDAHAEDGWIGREVRVGGASVRFEGNVGRCLVTTRNPDSGEVDLPTLDLLGAYRRQVASTEPLPFGIYGSVASAGAVAVGDPVVLSG